MKRALRGLRIIVALVAVSVAFSATGCKRKASDEAPTPVVRESSEGLLFTYIDEKGSFQVVDKRNLVPDDARALVRVVDTAHDQGGESDSVFVVDLRQAGADGLFAVSRMKRSELEARALARRAGKGTGPTTAGEPDVIIYGAEWCGPCHQAAAFLTQRGVPFVEKDIEKDPTAAREMQAKLAKSGMRGGSIPVLDVRGTIIVGFSVQAVAGALH